MEKMCHRLALKIFDTKEDPIASFHEHTNLLDSAINLPRQAFGGNDLYPTLVDKAAILFYTMNKNHPFKNGNKRISAASLVVFLYINDMWLNAGKSEIADKTLDVAKSPRENKDIVLADLKEWIKGHIKPLPRNLKVKIKP